jgi:hypothetical protein
MDIVENLPATVTGRSQLKGGKGGTATAVLAWLHTRSIIAAHLPLHKEEAKMNKVNRWAVLAGVILLALVVGGIAYNIGVTQGIEQSGKVVTAPGGPYPHHGWHRPWGFGFFFFPLFFIAFWFLIARGLFWRGGCGYGSRLDEWHRGAHERMTKEP